MANSFGKFLFQAVGGARSGDVSARTFCVNMANDLPCDYDVIIIGTGKNFLLKFIEKYAIDTILLVDTTTCRGRM